MQSLVILGLAFTLLATYIESGLTPEESTVSQVYADKVVRDKRRDTDPTPTITNITELPKANASILEVETLRARTTSFHGLTHSKKRELNLTTPAQSSSEALLSQPLLSQPLLSKPLPEGKKYAIPNLFKFSKKPSITYEAELVYDADKGKDITGGKVNITIPFG